MYSPPKISFFPATHLHLSSYPTERLIFSWYWFLFPPLSLTIPALFHLNLVVTVQHHKPHKESKCFKTVKLNWSHRILLTSALLFHCSGFNRPPLLDVQKLYEYWIIVKSTFLFFALTSKYKLKCWSVSTLFASNWTFDEGYKIQECT